MQRQALVQMAHSAQYAMAIYPPAIDVPSRHHGWRIFAACAIDQVSESIRNLVEISDIQIVDSWHELEALGHYLTGGGTK